MFGDKNISDIPKPSTPEENRVINGLLFLAQRFQNSKLQSDLERMLPQPQSLAEAFRRLESPNEFLVDHFDEVVLSGDISFFLQILISLTADTFIFLTADIDSLT
jgi:hypothetical protein